MYAFENSLVGFNETCVLAAAYYEAVVELVDEVLLDFVLQHAEVNHHSVFRRCGVGYWFSDDGYMELVGVSVYVAAQSVVVVECMCSVELKYFCYSNLGHNYICLTVYQSNGLAVGQFDCLSSLLQAFLPCFFGCKGNIFFRGVEI